MITAVEEDVLLKTSRKRKYHHKTARTSHQMKKIKKLQEEVAQLKGQLKAKRHIAEQTKTCKFVRFRWADAAEEEDEPLPEEYEPFLAGYMPAPLPTGHRQNKQLMIDVSQHAETQDVTDDNHSLGMIQEEPSQVPEGDTAMQHCDQFSDSDDSDIRPDASTFILRRGMQNLMYVKTAELLQGLDESQYQSRLSSLSSFPCIGAIRRFLKNYIEHESDFIPAEPAYGHASMVADANYPLYIGNTEVTQMRERLITSFPLREREDKEKQLTDAEMLFQKENDRLFLIKDQGSSRAGRSRLVIQGI